ncbi:MAG TPA: hypothetical protein PK191_09665 [Niabella sp.]|nr:hypothetical protein [Niabella sp.]HOZ96462.1 hypothetical protein [Niabella sp.]HQW13357.1 hypothetical protein [Niabella sp.]HQX18603.1 hypothetical protein [Niabella sp.]HRB06500.1 hypothetical protein [Niabella sp.]
MSKTGNILSGSAARGIKDSRRILKKYFFNCFLLTIPVLVWDYIFTDKLPSLFQPENFWKDIPAFIAYGENISRLVMFVFISLMPLKIINDKKKCGLLLYVAGVLLYFAAWVVLIYFPTTAWSNSVFGLLAPAYTPLFWLAGIGFIGDSLFFNIPYKRWLYFLLATIFLIFHNWHTYLIYFRTH